MTIQQALSRAALASLPISDQAVVQGGKCRDPVVSSSLSLDACVLPHRYRRRKREELDNQEEELRGLEGKNRELKDKAESVEREIQYVKDLLIEVYKARSQRLKQGSSA